MKLAKYVRKVTASMEAEHVESLRADLECGDLSDTQVAIDDHAQTQADLARQLVELTGDARETDSDAVELADMESRMDATLEGIQMVNANGGFTLESLKWAQHAVNAIMAPLGYNIDLQVASTESLQNGEKTVLSVENIEQVIEVIGATRQDVEALSVDGILRILAVLEEAIPDVKDRLVALQQSIRTLSYDEEAQIKLDDLIFKSLAVDGQLPAGLREYFTGYQNFANRILSTYSENALESASKATFLADALQKLGPDKCPIEAVSKAIKEIGDPRKVIDADQLMFVLPGSGPLFGNRVSEEDEEVPELEVPPAVVPVQTDAPAGDPATDPAAAAAAEIPVETPAADASIPSEPAVAPEAAPPAPEAAPAAEPAAAPAVEPAPAEGAPAPAEPVATSEEPDATVVEGEPAPAEGADTGTAVSTDVGDTGEDEEEEEEVDADGNPIVKPAKEAYSDVQAEAQITPVEALVIQFEKFTTNYAPLDPLSWEDRPENDTPTIRVLSKDTIDAVTGELIKALEIVNIKSFGESHRQTWAQSRSAFGAFRQAFDSLTPQQSADLAPAIPAAGEYLNTVFTLSAWPALHVLANMVFTANAFLLLAERSISGQSAEEDAFEAPQEEAEESDDTVMSDGDAANAGQANNDAQAGSRAADIGALSDASSTT